jgi:cytochrome c biogenesis protein
MQSFANRLFELLGSMRFAVSLLSVIAIASIAGTVVKQGEPYPNYLNQFGAFWFGAFEAIGLYGVYNAAWFIAILCFLVASVSVCIWRNAPWMLRDMRSFRESKRERTLRQLAHHAAFRSPLPAGEAALRAAQALAAAGYATRTRNDREALLVSAKAGSAQRLGYVLTHTAIVTICVGGLIDSNIPLKIRLALGQAQTTSADLPLSRIPAAARLAPDNLSFRGNLFIPEGQSGDFAVLNVGDGILVQDLPFTISLKKFHIEHYSTGQPKLFASDVIVTDKDTGRSFETRIEVNRPLIHRGIAAYQASFDDGGTRLQLAGHHLLAPAAKNLAFDARVGESLEFKYGGETYRLELTGFRPFNIEDTAGSEAEGEASPEARGALERLHRQMGSGKEAAPRQQLRNVGPSYSYKLRDAAGQAREYNNYMLPHEIEGRWMMLTGMREQPGEPFRYLRVPLDDEARLDGYWMLRAALLDERTRGEAARRFARSAMSGGILPATMRERVVESAERVLATFAQRGYQAVAEFLERAVPEAEREQAAEVYLRVLQGAAWEAWQAARARAGLSRLEATPVRVRFVQDALNAFSDGFHYGVPVYLALASYDEVKASVLQLTRSPGRNLVYAGCLALVLGVFTMLYVRERRAWVLIGRDGGVVLGASCNRRTLEFDREFEQLGAALRLRLAAVEETRNGTG